MEPRPAVESGRKSLRGEAFEKSLLMGAGRRQNDFVSPVLLEDFSDKGRPIIQRNIAFNISMATNTAAMLRPKI
jgi:hypothetical protein